MDGQWRKKESTTNLGYQRRHLVALRTYVRAVAGSARQRMKLTTRCPLQRQRQSVALDSAVLEERHSIALAMQVADFSKRAGHSWGLAATKPGIAAETPDTA